MTYSAGSSQLGNLIYGYDTDVRVISVFEIAHRVTSQRPRHTRHARVVVVRICEHDAVGQGQRSPAVRIVICDRDRRTPLGDSGQPIGIVPAVRHRGLPHDRHSGAALGVVVLVANLALRGLLVREVVQQVVLPHRRQTLRQLRSIWFGICKEESNLLNVDQSVFFQILWMSRTSPDLASNHRQIEKAVRIPLK
jgi:hypothetical protein